MSRPIGYKNRKPFTVKTIYRSMDNRAFDFLELEHGTAIYVNKPLNRNNTISMDNRTCQFLELKIMYMDVHANELIECKRLTP